jgi:deoxyadenosine/deoxycytidine kinase
MKNKGKGIVIQGSVGAGKSTLAEMLAAHTGITLFREPVKSNPYLEDYYKDPHKHGYAMQVFLLHERFKQALHATRLDEHIMDMSMYGNLIFASIMTQEGIISERNMNDYINMFHQFRKLTEPPALMVYLKCSTDECINRIQKRNRKSELDVERSYWEKLNQAYEVWYRTYSYSPKVEIDVTNINIVDSKESAHYVMETIMKEHVKATL